MSTIEKPLHPFVGTAILFVVLVGTAELARPFVEWWGVLGIATMFAVWLLIR